MLFHIGPAFIKAFERVICIEIAVGKLCGGDFVNPFVRFGFQDFIGRSFERISNALNDFIHIGIIKINAFVFAAAQGSIFEVFDSRCRIFGIRHAHG